MDEGVFDVECTGANTEPEQESIKDFLGKIKPDAARELCEEWGRICEDLEINLSYVRNEVDDWFQECYRSRKDVCKLNTDVSCEIADRRKEELLEEFYNNMQTSANRSDDIIHKLTTKREMEATRNLPPGCWVNKAITCVERENELMANFKKVKFNAEEEEMTRKMDRAIQQTDSHCKIISQKVNQFCNEVTNYLRYKTMFDHQETVIADFELLLSTKNDKKGASQKKLTELKNEKQRLQKSVDDTTASLNQCIQKVYGLLSEGYDLYMTLIDDILVHVTRWKKQFKFEYAELEAAPSLDRIAPWCALVGKQLFDLLFETLVQYSNSLVTLSVVEPNTDSVIKNYEDLLYMFLQETFVVTEQEHYIIKVDKKNFPRIVVRILAADYFPAHSSKIEAKFLYEDEINSYCPDSQATVKIMEIPTCAEFVNKKKNASVSFQTGKRKKCSEGTFQSLQFKDKFVRPANTNNKQVHEEKYRILFLTNLKDWKLWTMSLPLVVTTGANQGCLCQASIMWQCFSTDVYKVPIMNSNELQWCDVANMLQAKMRKLCPNRRLNEDNLTHLKRRLFGKDVKAEERVTLKMFCFDKMVKTYGSDEECLNFSFWKWFIGVYNLIDRYLLNFWKEDLIYGFISKEDAKEKLKRCSSGHSGTFILRFSDQNISDSQGVKSVFAHLTATVLLIKETDGRKKKCVYDLDVAGHSKLKIKNLANILMETIEAKKDNSAKIYQYVYPGKKKREDTFDKLCNEETVVQGYNGTKDAFIIDLSHAMCSMEIDTGKHARSPSIDSGFPLSPDWSESLASPVKRSRPSIEQQHPAISSLLCSRTPLSSPAYSNQGSSCNGASPVYPPFSPESPAQRNNSPPNSMLQQQAQHAPMQSDQIYPSLPTVINDVDLQSGERFMGKYNQSVTINQRNSPIQEVRMHSNTSPDGHESGLAYSSLSDDGSSQSAEEQLEVLISNDDTITLQCEDTDNGDNAVIYAVKMEGNQYKIVKDQATLNAILQQQHQNQQQTEVANQQQEAQLLQENFVSTNQISPSEHQRMLVNAILSKLPEDQLLSLLGNLPEELRNNFNLQMLGVNAVTESFPSMTTQQTDTTVNNTVDSMADMMISCCASTSLETPTLTSSGSMGDAFNFTIPEIAEARDMNSGSIDINMFEITSSGSGMPTGGNMSSGSSFGYGDA